MKGRYEAAFIIPVGASKVLCEDGWEFETPNRLSSEIAEFLVDALNLQFSENYLGIDRYVGENIEMSVFYDDQGQIESIQFQLYGDSMTVLVGVFQASSIASQSELFIPDREST